MLSIKNISKSFGGTIVLQGVSFGVVVGKVTALIGLNGAGKTTLFDIVSGFVRADSGSVSLTYGHRVGTQHLVPLQKDENSVFVDMTNLETYERARLGISRTFQQVRLCENLTIGDHFMLVEDNEDELLFRNVISNLIWEPERKKKNKKTVIASERKRSVAISLDAENEIASDNGSGQPSSLAMTDKKKEYIEFLKSLDLQKPLDTRVLDLSYGQRKLLDFGLAVYRKHVLLMLDEPVAGVNQVIRKRIHHLLENLKHQGETILLIEHDIDFVRALADEVIVLDEGKVLTIGKPELVLTDKKVLEAYLGE